MQEIVVPLFYDVISKYDIIASTHMVAIGFLIMHCECNLALQMASTEKLETRAVRWHSVQNIKKRAATHRKHAVSSKVFFYLDTCFREGTPEHQRQGREREQKESYTDVSGECVKNDKLLTVKPLETKFDVSYGTMQTIHISFLMR